jgi:hypothetical protein
MHAANAKVALWHHSWIFLSFIIFLSLFIRVKSGTDGARWIYRHALKEAQNAHMGVTDSNLLERSSL